MITELNERNREIFRLIVDSFLESGAPVASRALSEGSAFGLSSATLRNIMADLEDLGLLCSPHTSAGRIPTQQGLRFYIDGLMQIGSLSGEDQKNIRRACEQSGASPNALFEKASTLLSGLSTCASIVLAPKMDKPVKEIQFVALDQTRILVVLVSGDGMVENRIIAAPPGGVSPSALIRAGNYLSEKLRGQTLHRARKVILEEIAAQKSALDEIGAALVKMGLALPLNTGRDGMLIVRGQSNLLNDIRVIEDLEKARNLFALLEEQETMLRLLDASRDGDGVQIYIGTENTLFEGSNWSTILSPYRDSDNNIVGAIGVIGPLRLNYGRVVPMVDYTAKVMGRMLSTKGIRTPADS